MTVYEPGTVATATVRGVKGVRAFLYCRNPGVYWWATAEQVEGYIFHTDQHVTDIVPLRAVPADAVVLNLSASDVEHVEMLINDLRDCHWLTLANQIEAQTKPPRPNEPGEFGAKVRDTKGRLWLRIYSAEAIPLGEPAWRGEMAWAARWDHIDVAEVLS